MVVVRFGTVVMKCVVSAAKLQISQIHMVHQNGRIIIYTIIVVVVVVVAACH